MKLIFPEKPVFESEMLSFLFFLQLFLRLDQFVFQLKKLN